MRATLRSFAALALLAAAAACGGSDDALFEEDAERTLDVVMREMEFEPDRLVVRAGELVELRIINAGSVEHDFTIDHIDAESAVRVEGHVHGVDAEVHVHLGAGEQGVLRLRVPAPGEHDFYCAEPGHREAGMTGRLLVQ